MRIGEERVESRAHGEIHRQGVFRIAEIPAQVAQLGACAQRRVAADVLQRPLPRGAQIHGQRVGRDVGAFEVHVAADDADGPPVADAARITQVDGHVVVAVFAEELPPAGLHEVDVVEPAESRHGVIVEAPLSVIGGGDLRRRVREDGRRGVVVDGVRTGKGGHHHAAHAQRLGVGAGKRRLDSLSVCLERGQRREQGYESFHVAKIVKCGTEANPVRRNLPVCRKRRCDAGGQQKRCKLRRLFRQLRHTLRFRAVIVGGASASKRKISTEYCPKTKAPFQVNLAGAFIFRRRLDCIVFRNVLVVCRFLTVHRSAAVDDLPADIRRKVRR